MARREQIDRVRRLGVIRPEGVMLDPLGQTRLVLRKFAAISQRGPEQSPTGEIARLTGGVALTDIPEPSQRQLLDDELLQLSDTPDARGTSLHGHIEPH